MCDQKLCYAIGKLVDDKMAAALDFYELKRPLHKLLSQFGSATANARVGFPISLFEQCSRGA